MRVGTARMRARGADHPSVFSCARRPSQVYWCSRFGYLDPTVSRDVIVVSSTSPTTLKQKLETKVNLENSIEVCEKFIQERNSNESNG